MIEERSWFGTQLQSISKERLLPTRDSLFGIIRRIERPLNRGMREKYGSGVGSTGCLQNWLCGLAHSTVNIRNHKSPEFPEQCKSLVHGLRAGKSAPKRSPRVAPKLPVHFLLLIPLLLPPSPSFSSHVACGHLSGSNCC